MKEYDEYLQRYKNFKPTKFDSHINIEVDEGDEEENYTNREDWFVLPFSVNRDTKDSYNSGSILEESNYKCSLEELGGEGKNVEVHRFKHWACGWFEIVLVRPDTKEAKNLLEIVKKYKDYPVLDEMHLGEKEYEAAGEVWDNMSIEERKDFLKKNKSGHEKYADLYAQMHGEILPENYYSLLD